MTARPPTPTTDPRADAYRRALSALPMADHVAALRARGIPIPPTQAAASALLTDAIRREVRR